MNILVIGNGFDLAHGLPTKYEDFLVFLDKVKEIKESRRGIIKFDKNKSENEVKNELLKKAFDGFDKRCDDSKKLRVFENMFCNICDKRDEHEFCRKTGHCDFLTKAPEDEDEIIKNKWADYFLSIYKKISGENWIDIEAEICKIIKTIDEMKGVDIKDHARKVLDKNTSIAEAIDLDKNYQADEVKKKEYVEILEKDLDKFIKCLEQYMLFVDQINVEYRSQDIEDLSIDKVLNFNYTNTYKKYYKQNFHEDDCNHIHGKAGQSNLILGINDYLEGAEKNEKLLCIRFKKYFQRIHKKTGCMYKVWLSEKQQCNVFIFGHSLDVTDKDVFRDIILNENVQTTIYYHDKEAYAKQIINLVKIIGQEKLIEKVYNENSGVKFVHQQYMKRTNL